MFILMGILLPILPVIMGTYMLLGGISNVVGMHRLMQNHEVTEASVESVRDRGRAGTRAYYTFQARGFVHRGYSDFLTWDLLPGMVVPIYFNPDDLGGTIIPTEWVERNGFPGFLVSNGSGVLLSLLYYTLAMFPIWFAAKGWHNDKKHQELILEQVRRDARRLENQQQMNSRNKHFKSKSKKKSIS